MSQIPEYTRKDFQSDVSVKWCPGCGDHSILNTLINLMPKIGKKKEDIVFISGIGCSSRFPYYMNTYGFHTIHGRAPAIASGAKIANPNLDIWMITGDGDALSIGGNHFIHAIRRNQDIKILLFNNRIYGLTKGQSSPTSEVGTKTKSTPYGSIDYPVNPLSLAVSAGAGFVARTVDNDPKHMAQVFEAASKYKGTAVVEILQNCVIFNDKVHEPYYGRPTRDESLLYLEHDKPAVYGAQNDKAIIMDGMTPRVVLVTEDSRESLPCYREDFKNSTPAHILANLEFPEFPVPVGVIRNVERPTYTEMLEEQIEGIQKEEGIGTLEDLLNSGLTWSSE